MVNQNDQTIREVVRRASQTAEERDSERFEEIEALGRLALGRSVASSTRFSGAPRSGGTGQENSPRRDEGLVPRSMERGPAWLAHWALNTWRHSRARREQHVDPNNVFVNSDLSGARNRPRRR